MRRVLLPPGESGDWVTAIEGYVLALQEDGLEVPFDSFEAVSLAV